MKEYYTIYVHYYQYGDHILACSEKKKMIGVATSIEERDTIINNYRKKFPAQENKGFLAIDVVDGKEVVRCSYTTKINEYL